MGLHQAQRWQEKRCRWVKERDVVDTKTLDVALIPDDTTARAFVQTHHYSGSYPAARARVGLYQHGHIVGVAVFSEPMNVRVVPKWLQLDRREGVELGRFVLLDEVGFNAETWFLSRAFKLVHKTYGWRGVLAYSDPVAREDIEGNIVMPGHIGTIYQAHNARYMGRGSKRTLLLDKWGRVISARMLSKIKQQSRGHRYAEEHLVSLGAPQKQPGEVGAAYLKRALDACVFDRLRHPGNHCYAWSLEKGLQLTGTRRDYPSWEDVMAQLELF